MAHILENTAFIGGEAVKKFEAAFAEFCQAKYCIGVGNGTDALQLVFTALGLKPGDEVITTPMTFIATAEPLMMMGITPVFVDIESDTYNLDPMQVKAKLNSKIKAILPVHLYGQPASLKELLALGLPVIEDSAQAHGATYQNQRIGGLGIAATFSFYPGKNLGAFGDGGAITTNDPALADQLRKLADHGRTTKYEHEFIGVNSRLDGLQAAILSVKLKHLARWNAQRQAWATLYNDLLKDIPQLVLPEVRADRTSVYHQYVVQVENRERFMKALADEGIQTGIHYPIPLHLQPAFKNLGHTIGDFPISEQLANRCVSLPMYAELTEEEVHRVAASIRQFFENH